ncbi:tRNA pseudouridine(55) synthase TruB [uncultured Draconibacterium sp.]|uniref:tRNA pseudouridine(55) synthase TruB n=1 Tax=uncultured Draconibacterium sp. TaxID=1573823 RepID=UPI0025E2FB09|nr:tRNA pseudouridine(55) synthase TruB [uncultured Draconibacterium sp.]
MPDFKKTYNFSGGEILLFDKELEWTSFDVVNKVRYILCQKLGIKKMKVGHAGTLDPLASGLVILCTGKATKKIEELQLGEKEYLATLKLGATTPSFDLETEEDKQYDYNHISREDFEKILPQFIGEIKQVPPVFSAVKVRGKRAFNYARNGEEVKLKAKSIVIKSIEIESFNLPEVKLRIVCGKGTYIRSLARDIGEALQCGAYLTGLKRTRIGNYKLEDAFNVNFFLENLILDETN